jgi:hypothetical protein
MLGSSKLQIVLLLLSLGDQGTEHSVDQRLSAKNLLYSKNLTNKCSESLLQAV